MPAHPIVSLLLLSLLRLMRTDSQWWGREGQRRIQEYRDSRHFSESIDCINRQTSDIVAGLHTKNIKISPLFVIAEPVTLRGTKGLGISESDVACELASHDSHGEPALGRSLGMNLNENGSIDTVNVENPPQTGTPRANLWSPVRLRRMWPVITIDIADELARCAAGQCYQFLSSW